MEFLVFSIIWDENGNPDALPEEWQVKIPENADPDMLRMWIATSLAEEFNTNPDNFDYAQI